MHRRTDYLVACTIRVALQAVDETVARLLDDATGPSVGEAPEH